MGRARLGGAARRCAGEDRMREGCRTGKNLEEQEVGCHVENTSEEGGHHVVGVLARAR
jgi:hypothetical protein